MDPLAISTGQGKGFAQVFKSDERSSVDYVLEAQRKKKEQEQAQKAKQEQVQKQKDQAFKDLHNIKLDGFVKDNKALYDMQLELYNDLHSGYMSNGESYNYKVDPNYMRKLNKLEEMNNFSKDTQTMFTQEWGKLQQNKDAWSPESVKEVTDYYNMSLPERYEYINSGNPIPSLRPKEQYFDWQSKWSGVKVKQRSFSNKTDDGTTTTLSSGTTTPEEDIETWANAFLDKGDEYAQQLLKDIEKGEADNVNYDLLPEEGKAIYLRQKALDKLIALKKAQQDEKSEYSQDVKGSAYSYGNGRVENSKWMFAYDNGAITMEGMDAPENRVMTFQVPEAWVINDEGKKEKSTEGVISIVPLAIDYKGAGSDEPLLVGVRKRKVNVGTEVAPEWITKEEEVKIPWKYAKGKFEALTGIGLQDLKNAFGLGTAKQSDTKVTTEKGKTSGSTPEKKIESLRNKYNY